MPNSWTLHLLIFLYHHHHHHHHRYHHDHHHLFLLYVFMIWSRMYCCLWSLMYCSYRKLSGHLSRPADPPINLPSYVIHINTMWYIPKLCNTSPKGVFQFIKDDFSTGYPLCWWLTMTSHDLPSLPSSLVPPGLRSRNVSCRTWTRRQGVAGLHRKTLRISPDIYWSIGVEFEFMTIMQCWKFGVHFDCRGSQTPDELARDRFVPTIAICLGYSGIKWKESNSKLQQSKKMQENPQKWINQGRQCRYPILVSLVYCLVSCGATYLTSFLYTVNTITNTRQYGRHLSPQLCFWSSTFKLHRRSLSTKMCKVYLFKWGFP